MVTDWMTLNHRHKGDTIWVVGSGKTLDYVAPAFFDDKVVIGVNQSLEEIGVQADYWVTNHHGEALRLANEHPTSFVFTSETEQVPPEHRQPTVLDLPNIMKVPTTDQHYGRFDANLHWSQSRFVLTLGPSSAVLGLSVAEFLGAQTIMLVALDCGEIDGEKNSIVHRPVAAGADPAHYHYRLWDKSLVTSAGVLRRRGIQVHSLNPWVTLNLEGHTFEQ